MSKVTNEKIITIYTWGSKLHSQCPVKTEKDINVAGISNYKPRGLNLKKERGWNPKLKQHIQRQSKYELYMARIRKYILEEGLTTISIYCHKGRHRSVAVAEILLSELKEINMTVRVYHLDA